MRAAVVATPLIFTDVRFTSVKHRFVTTKALNRHYFFKLFLVDFNAWIWQCFLHRFWTTLASILGPIFHHFSGKCRFLAIFFFIIFCNGFWISFLLILCAICGLLGASGVDPRIDFWLPWSSSRVLGRPGARPGGCLGPFWSSWGRSGTIFTDFTPLLVSILHSIHHDFTAHHHIIHSPL